MSFFTRFRHVFIQFLTAIDQLLHVVFATPKYLFFGGAKPNADETISSKVGRKAIQGRRWALIAEYVINLMFFWQKDENGRRNHCRTHIEFDELP